MPDLDKKALLIIQKKPKSSEYPAVEEHQYLVDGQGDEDEVEDGDPKRGAFSQAKPGLNPGSDEGGARACQAKDNEEYCTIHPGTAT